MPVARVNGINLDYSVVGKGEPLILIMGMGFGQKGWIFQTRFFRQYFQVITFDNRGSGNSDKPEGPYSTRMMAEDTIGLMDYLHIGKAHVLGISLGGMIAQEMAINYPQRINKLVLGSTFCKHDHETSGDTPEFEKAVTSGLQGEFDRMFNLLINKRLNKMLFIPVMKRAMKKSGTAGITGLAGQRQAGFKHNTADRLPLIKTPTLVIAGTEDRVIRPGSSRLISGLIPGSKLIMIDKGSHTLFMEMRSRFNQLVLDFLKNE
jgi:pimeloyl-ACP methyl ester carboxylesterase